MTIIKSVLLYSWQFVKMAVVWGIDKRNWKTIRQGIEMSKQLSEFAKANKTAKQIGILAEQFDKLTKTLSDDDTKKAAELITKSGGVLEDLNLGFNAKTKSIGAGIGPVKVNYSPEDGSVSISNK
jgi:hypothetical protein